MYFTKEVNAMLTEEKKPLLSTADMAEKIEKALYELEFLREDLSSVDYISYRETEWHPHILEEHQHKDWYQDVRAIVCTGGSEGIYVDVYVRRMYLDDQRTDEIPLMTVKTLHEGVEDYASMGRIAGAITYLGEAYLFLNMSLIEEKEAVS